MVVNTQEEYNKFPDGTIFNLFLEGEEWDNDFCKVEKVVKLGNHLLVLNNHYDFSERDDKGYETKLMYSEQLQDFFKV
jgi:hypothetical protein